MQLKKQPMILLHGEAISVGMVVASHLSASKGLLSNQDVERIETLLAMLELPITLDMDRKKMIDAIKKRQEKAGEMISILFYLTALETLY